MYRSRGPWSVPPEDLRDRICINSSVAFGPEDGVEYHNALEFGTDEWQEAYRHDRNAVESYNNGAKHEGEEDIDDPFARRKRGRAAAFFAITMMTVQVNIRRILRFLRDEAARIKRSKMNRVERKRDREGISEYARRKGLKRVESDPSDIDEESVVLQT